MSNGGSRGGAEHAEVGARISPPGDQGVRSLDSFLPAARFKGSDPLIALIDPECRALRLRVKHLLPNRPGQSPRRDSTPAIPTIAAAPSSVFTGLSAAAVYRLRFITRPG
jgi:hypothetical protein